MYKLLKKTADPLTPQQEDDRAAKRRVEGLIALTTDEIAALRCFNGKRMMSVQPSRYGASKAVVFLLENVLFRAYKDQWYFATLRVRFANEMPAPPRREISPAFVFDFGDLFRTLKQWQAEYDALAGFAAYTPPIQS